MPSPSLYRGEGIKERGVRPGHDDHHAAPAVRCRQMEDAQYRGIVGRFVELFRKDNAAVVSHSIIGHRTLMLG